MAGAIVIPVAINTNTAYAAHNIIHPQARGPRVGHMPYTRYADRDKRRTAGHFRSICCSAAGNTVANKFNQCAASGAIEVRFDSSAHWQIE